MSRSGFTLVELIVVIAIIAILAAIVAPNAFKAVEKSKISEAIGDFKSFKTAMYALYADTGTWGLQLYCGAGDCYLEMANYAVLVRVPGAGLAGWDGPYLEKLKGKTPWRGTYVIQSSNCGQAGAREIWLEFESACFGGGEGCVLTPAARTKLDSQIDDGNPATGEFRVCTGGAWCYCSDQDTIWNIVWDAW